MKTHLQNLFLLPTLIIGLNLIVAGPLMAQNFTLLYNFTNVIDNSVGPAAGLVLSGNTLYGTTYSAGSVFAINTDGTGYRILYNFTNYYRDGEYPLGPLTLSGNTLYGTTSQGGQYPGNGTVFAINTDGTGFTNLYSFTGTYGGWSPRPRLILSGNALYGTMQAGGSNYNGFVFGINTDGTGFTNLHNFTGILDGTPQGGLILPGNTLYGTAMGVTSGNDASVFAVHTDGTGFTNLFVFPIYCEANAGIILSGNTFYGTAPGYANANGRVFSLSFEPQLTIVPSQTNVILTWLTNNLGFDYTSFTLQSTPNLIPPAVWTTVSPAPVVVNGQNTVTNPISGTQMFYRLSQ